MGCGIAGIVGLTDGPLLKSMCEVIRHRGPNHTDYFLDSNVGLGIDRLSVIDLKTGNQPIHNEDGSIWIVFNGEIYGYKELRPSLEAGGHSFYTDSDTECIVHAYEEWGTNCLAHLRGMFAFAIWDSKRKRLFLARDRFGKKPLYYAQVGHVLLFGSEMKAILQHEEFPRELDLDAVDYFFSHGYIPSPLSIFKNIKKLQPGSFGLYSDGRLTLEKYWDYDILPDPSRTEDELVELLYHTIEDAVRIRMRSDVPYGAFLSGGIDSSIVASIMSRQSEEPVKTVSIGFDTMINELPYSRQIAELLGTDHREHVVTPQAFKILPELVWHFDEPFADHSMIPTYYLSEVSRAEVTVALSGDGGDELFMGYPFLLDPASYSVYSRVPRTFRRPTLKMLTKLPMDRQFKRMAGHAYEKGYGNQSYEERFAMRMTMLDSEGLRKMYSAAHNSSHAHFNPYGYTMDLTRQCKSTDPLDAVDYATVRSYLEEDILAKVDRMSMAVSLEVRCPLLDQEVAAIVGTIPSRLKMNGRETKYILKKMALKKNLIPRTIATRKKQGFGAPIESWMKGEWKELTEQALDPIVSHGYTGLFDADTVKRFLGDPYAHSNKLFALTVFVTWYRMYIEREMVRPIARGSMTN